jgi:hypothetical protein
VHKDIALNEGKVISLALFGTYKVSEKYFESKNYDGRKIIGPCVILCGGFRKPYIRYEHR